MISAGTPVTLTVGQFLGGLATIAVTGIGAVWVVGEFQTGGMHDDMSSIRDDIKSIRTSIGNLQGADKDSVIRLDGTAEKLSAQIAELTKQLAVFGGRLDVANTSVTFLSKQLDNLERSPKLPPKE